MNYAALNYHNQKNRYASLINILSKKIWVGGYETLDFIVVIANRDERVVSPPENVTFGMKILDDGGNTISKPITSEFIKTHPMIDEFWRNRKLIHCLSDTSHSELFVSELKWINDSLFNEAKDATTYEESSIKMKDLFFKHHNNYCCMNNPTLKTADQYYNVITNGRTGISSIEFETRKNLV